MKKNTILLIAIILMAFSSLGQINLEYTYEGVSAAYVNLPVEGYKFYVMDVPNSQCRIYNNDHSLWKTINLSVPANYYLCDIQYVSEDLFNTDNSIELLYVSYNYNSASGYYTYDTRIATEAGTVLLSVPGGGYSTVYPSESGSKLFVWVYDYSLAVYTVNTMIYSIPGRITAGTPGLLSAKPAKLGPAFPNPASSEVIIPYTLPENVDQAKLKIYSIEGNLVKTFVIDHSFNNLTLQTNDLPAGMYNYRIESGRFNSDSYKLVVNR